MLNFFVIFLSLLGVSLYGTHPSSIPGNKLIVQAPTPQSPSGDDMGDDEGDEDEDDTDEDVIIMDDDEDVNN